MRLVLVEKVYGFFLIWNIYNNWLVILNIIHISITFTIKY